jgi:hypothetical protein
MKKLIQILFCCLFSSIFAEPAVTIDEPEQYSIQIEALSVIASQSEPAYYYRVKAVDLNNRTVTMNNDATFDIGWWYKDSIQDWQVGDRVSIAYYSPLYTFEAPINSYGLRNLDKDSLAWGSFKPLDWPDYGNSDIIIKVYNFATITLKSGFEFIVPPRYLRGINVLNKRVFVFETDQGFWIDITDGPLIRGAGIWEVGNQNWQ